MPTYFEFEVALKKIEPKIWRRFLIRANATFADLHDAIQDACGWTDTHLFAFETRTGTPIAGIPDEESEKPDPPANRVRLSDYFGKKAKSCDYVYDMGDDWEHDVTLVRTVEMKERFHRRLLDGRRAFPPEDCGSYPGYEDCVQVAKGGPDPEGLREWLGDWQPEAFDLEAVRREFNG